MSPENAQVLRLYTLPLIKVSTLNELNYYKKHFPESITFGSPKKSFFSCSKKLRNCRNIFGHFLALACNLLKKDSLAGFFL